MGSRLPASRCATERQIGDALFIGSHDQLRAHESVLSGSLAAHGSNGVSERMAALRTEHGVPIRRDRENRTVKHQRKPRIASVRTRAEKQSSLNMVVRSDAHLGQCRTTDYAEVLPLSPGISNE